MKRIVSLFFWIGLFIVLLVGMDQYFMRTQTQAPLLSEMQAFYRDFRGRLTGILDGRQDEVAKAIENSASQADKTNIVPSRSPEFLYVDGGGQLHFADSFEEIPPPYRQDAQRLEQNEKPL